MLDMGGELFDWWQWLGNYFNVGHGWGIILLVAMGVRLKRVPKVVGVAKGSKGGRGIERGSKGGRGIEKGSMGIEKGSRVKGD